LHHRRLAFAFLGKKDSIKILFDEIAPVFSERQGGYTRVLKLGRRSGDAASMSILQLVGFEKISEVSKSEKKKKTKKVEETAEERVETADSENQEGKTKKLEKSSKNSDVKEKDADDVKPDGANDKS
jgi:large subunit ribosomal protein L17